MKCIIQVNEVNENVITNVIESIRAEFLESGVDLETLRKLENLWREKLANRKSLIRNLNSELPKKESDHFQNYYYPVNISTCKLKQIASSKRMLTQQELEFILLKSRETANSSRGNGPAGGMLELVGNQCNSSSANIFMWPKSKENSSIPQTDGAISDISNVESDDNDEHEIDDRHLQKVDSADEYDSDVSFENIPNLPTDYFDKDEEVNACEFEYDNVSDIDDDDNSSNRSCSYEEINSDHEEEDHDPNWSDCEDVIYCTFEKIVINNTRYLINLQNGLMNIKGKDYVFNKLSGNARWKLNNFK